MLCSMAFVDYEAQGKSTSSRLGKTRRADASAHMRLKKLTDGRFGAIADVFICGSLNDDDWTCRSRPTEPVITMIHNILLRDCGVIVCIYIYV